MPSVPVDTRSLDEIYAAALKESGPLIVAAGGDGMSHCVSRFRFIVVQWLTQDPTAQAQWDVVRAAFAKRFPKLGLDLTVDFSKYHDSRIDRAVQSGTHIADVVFIQDLHPRWTEQNVLLNYKPPTFDDIYNSHKDVGGAYFGATLCEYLQIAQPVITDV